MRRRVEGAVLGMLMGVLAPGCEALFDVDALERGHADAADGGTPARSRMQVVDFDKKPRVTYRSVWVEARDKVYIAGDDGVLLMWDGANWGVYTSGSGVNLHGVWTSATDGYAVGELRDTHRGIVLRRDSTGWSQLATTDQGLWSVWGSKDARFAAGNDGALLTGPPSSPFSEGRRFVPAPEVPTTPFAPILWSIGGVSSGPVVVAGDVDTYHVLEGGEWRTASDAVDRTRAYRAVWGIEETQTILLGANYYGLWRREREPEGALRRLSLLNEDRSDPQNVERFFLGIWGIGERVVCVGTGGRIMTWDPEHVGRIQESPGGARTLYSVSGSSFDDVWMVGEDGLILHGSMAD